MDSQWQYFVVLAKTELEGQQYVRLKKQKLVL
jgi:hypothetical protein